MSFIEAQKNLSPLAVVFGQTEMTATGSLRRIAEARANGKTAIAANGRIYLKAAAAASGQTLLTARGRLNRQPNLFGAALLSGKTEITAAGAVLIRSYLRVSGKTEITAAGAVLESESATLDLIVDIIPAAVINNYQDYGVRLTVGGNIVEIESAETEEAEDSAGKTFSAVIANFADRQYFIVGAEIVFEVNINGAWFEELRGVMTADNFSLANADDAPADRFSLTMNSQGADRLAKFPANDLTVYDSARASISPEEIETAYDSAGRAFQHQTLAVPYLNLHGLFNLTYVGRCGFSAVRTNLPNYRLRRAEFDVSQTYHGAVNAFVGMFKPVTFVLANELWIVDVSAALPAGFPAPATLDASRIDGFQSAREYNRIDGYRLQVSGGELGSYYTTDLRQSTAGVGNLRTETAATYRQYRLISQPNVIVGEVLKSQTVTEYDESINLSFIISRTREDFNYDGSGRFKSSVKTIEKLVPNLPSDNTEILRTAKTIETTVTYKTHPFERGKQYLSGSTISSFGLIAIDEENEFLGKAFPQDFTKALEAGNLKDGMFFQEGQIEASYTNYRPLRNGQVEVTGATVDYVPAAVGRSPIAKPHDTGQPAGDISLNSANGVQSEIRVFPTDGYVLSGRGIESFSVGELPLEFAIPLARRNLFRVINGQGKITANIIGLDLSVRRGSLRRIHDREAEIAATMVVEGLKKIFTAEKTSMVLTGRQI